MLEPVHVLPLQLHTSIPNKVTTDVGRQIWPLHNIVTHETSTKHHRGTRAGEGTGEGKEVLLKYP